MARILATGLYAPGTPISNEELKKLAGIDFDSERTESKIGIRSRHIAHLRGLAETTADFAEKAARNALAAAGETADTVDCIVVGTDTPEYISPATAILVQGRLQGGQRNTMVLDVGASCAGFVTAFDVATRIVDSNPTVRRALVIGVYNMPAYVRPGDAFGYSIFADGAAAFLLERDPTGYVGSLFVADGTQWNYIGVYSGGTHQPITHERLEKDEYGLQLLQKLPGDRNLKLWPPLVRELAGRHGVSLNEIDHFIFTQINRSIIEQVMAELGQALEKAPMVMDRYGYTGSACVPMAYHTAVCEQKIKRGDLIITCASGAGLAVGCNLLRA